MDFLTILVMRHSKVVDPNMEIVKLIDNPNGIVSQKNHITPHSKIKTNYGLPDFHLKKVLLRDVTCQSLCWTPPHFSKDEWRKGRCWDSTSIVVLRVFDSSGRKSVHVKATSMAFEAATAASPNTCTSSETGNPKTPKSWKITELCQYVFVGQQQIVFSNSFLLSSLLPKMICFW